MTQLREALEASWDGKTSYRGVFETENIFLGQCYPTSRVVQFFFLDTEIVEGLVCTGDKVEKHFWNLLRKDDFDYHLDFTWGQFPVGSIVESWEIRDRETLGDSPETIRRIEILNERVKNYLLSKKRKPSHE